MDRVRRQVEVAIWQLGAKYSGHASTVLLLALRIAADSLPLHFRRAFVRRGECQTLAVARRATALVGEAFYQAQIVKADKIHPIEVYPKEENKHAMAIWDVKDAGVTRNGKKVLVKMVAVRSTCPRDSSTPAARRSSLQPASGSASIAAHTAATVLVRSVMYVSPSR